MLALGEIRYANCIPVQAPFRARWGGAYRFAAGEPAAVNQMLATGAIDCGPVSSIELARHPDRYQVIPDLAIAARGPARSVLLLTPHPVAALGGKEVWLTPASATSVVLLRILLERFAGVRPIYCNGEPNEPRSARLLIGDRAMAAAATAPTGVTVVDLGAWWAEQTGLPMVFALWLLHRAHAARAPAACTELAQRLAAARDEGLAHLDDLARAHATATLEQATLSAYWRTLSYHFGARERAGLERFFTLAAELGAVARVPQLTWVAGT